MKIGYARESGLWFPLEAKKKILLNEEIDSLFSIWQMKIIILDFFVKT